MNRNFCVGVLIICFGSSSVNLGWADEIMQVAPVVVQPYEVQQLTQQVIDTDRKNRDEEIAIQNLIEQNNKLTQNTLAAQEDEGLKKVNETMLSYRKMLYSRDQARIMANGQRWASRYGDLVALTEDADDMTDYRKVLNAKNGLLTEKYQMLTNLKDEMTELNNKLQGEGTDALHQKDNVIQGYKKIAQEQQSKIQMLVNRLDEMDRRLSKYDEIIAKKDEQIARLRGDLIAAQNLDAAKDATIKEEQDQIAILLEKAKDLSAKGDQIQSQANDIEDLSKSIPAPAVKKVALSPIYVHPQAPTGSLSSGNARRMIARLKNQVQEQKDELKVEDETISAEKSQIAALQSQPEAIQAPVSGNARNVIARLKNQIQDQKDELNVKDEMIKSQKNQIVALQSQSSSAVSNNQSSDSKDPIDSTGEQVAQKQEQVDLLKDELENKITELRTKDALIKSQADQLEKAVNSTPGQTSNSMIETYKNQIQEQNDDLKTKDELIKTQEEQLHRLSQQMKNRANDADNIHAQIVSLKDMVQEQANDLTAKDKFIQTQTGQIDHLQDQNNSFDNFHAQIVSLKSLVQEQADDLRAKNASLNWLNKVLAASKDKTEYFKLTAQKSQLSLQQVQDEIRKIRDDFAQRASDTGRLENIIASLKEELSRKNEQIRQDAQLEQDLKTQLQGKQDQISALKTELNVAMQQQNKVIDLQNASIQMNDSMGLAKQLIELQNQESSLLDQKSRLALQQYDIFDRHFGGFEKRMKILLASHQIQTTDFITHMDELRGLLRQKQEQIALLNSEMRNKIAQETNQSVLAEQIQDLKSQLQDKENSIVAMRAKLESGSQTEAQADQLKQQLADQQNKVDLLKQELESKNVDSDKMTAMIADYQKKLESKNNEYIQELMQVARIKKDMIALQALTTAKDRDIQEKDLSLSMMQQKMLDEKIKAYQDKIGKLQTTGTVQALELKNLRTELALARQQLIGMPSSDEIDYLRSGLKKATAQLKQKDQMLSQTKANADEYEKEFKEQTGEFQSLKVQLQNAYDDISRRNDDLKYKSLEVARLKERASAREGDLMDQIKVLDRELKSEGKKTGSEVVYVSKPAAAATVKTGGANVQALQEQLDSANLEIRNLQDQLAKFILPAKQDALRIKLKQALDKIDAQGRVITVLSQKLQAAGQNVDLSRQ